MTIRYVMLPYFFTVTLEQDEENWFIASVEGLPGVVSQGQSIQEAMDNIAGAVEDALSVMQQDGVRGNNTTPPSIEEEKFSSITPVRMVLTRAVLC